MSKPAETRKRPATRRLLTPGALLAATVLSSGCISAQQRVANKEDLLSAAGFDARPANTPRRIALLRSLPPDKFVRQVHNDSITYVFADPVVCGCLYIGDQQAYGRYQQDVFQRRLADQQQMTAEMNQADWDWGPWGGGPGFY